MSRKKPLGHMSENPQTYPIDNNYNSEMSRHNKNSHYRARSKSKNRRVSQNNWVRNTPPNQNKTPEKFQSPKDGPNQQSSAQHHVTITSPPKTICKNKSLPFCHYPFTINENAGFYLDIQHLINGDNVEDPFIEDGAIQNNLGVVKFNSPTTSATNDGSERNNSTGAVPKILKQSKHLKFSDTKISQTKELNGTTTSDPSAEVLKNKKDVKGDSNGVNASLSVDQERISWKESTNCKLVQELTENNEHISTEINKAIILDKLPTLDTKSSGSESEKPKTFKSKILERIHKKPKWTMDKIKSTIVNGEVENHKYSQQPMDNCQEICKCDTCDNFIECSAWCNNNLSFAEPQNLKRGLPLLKDNMEKLPTITKTLDNKIILQGPIIPKSMFSLDETFMDEAIQNTLRTLNCTTAKDIQSYMWPAVQRGLSVFMVGPSKCGKTFAYLPAFCSFCIEKNERYAELSKYEGPLIIILVATAEDCYELQNSTKKVIGSGDVTVEVLTDESSVQGKCDILIAVPSVLEHCLKTSSVKIKRLCHIAIEKGHLVLKNQFQSIEKILKAINILQTNRPYNKNIQVVVSSEKWSLDLETLLKKLYTTPLVCFEDFLEAAVYSKVQFKKKKTKTTYKLFQLSDILRQHYMTQKTVVFCSEDEIVKLKDQLEVSGIECIAISNNLIEDEIFENEDRWNSLRSGQFKILLCTDAVFEKTVNVQSAQWLVHYHLPTEWSPYQKRFRCFSANISSPFDPEETTIYEFQSKCSFIIIDEFYNDQLFLDFFEILTRNCIKNLQL